MDQQKTALQTPIADVTDDNSLASENVESHLLTHTQVCHSQKNQRSSTSASTLKHYGRRMKLYCRHGYNILVFPNGTVSSSDDDKDSHCIMEFTSMSPGHVRIKGVEANLFLAMNKNGLLYGEPDPTKSSTIFIEQPRGPYSAYLSYKYQRKDWYIAIKKNGKIKLGPESKIGQHATHFLTILV